jgi:hypothetical protein
MSVIHALLEAIITAPVDMVAHSVSDEFQNAGDPRDHPVYKKKLEALIERNKRFEEARNLSDKAE